MLIAYTLSDGTYLIFGGMLKSLCSVSDSIKKIITKLTVRKYTVLQMVAQP